MSALKKIAGVTIYGTVAILFSTLAVAACSPPSTELTTAVPAEGAHEGTTTPRLIGNVGDCDLYEVIHLPRHLGRRVVWITRCPNDVAMTVLNP